MDYTGQKYRNYRNTLKSLIKIKKEHYFAKQIQQNPSYSKTIWKIRKPTNENGNNTTQISANNDLIQDELDMKNLFNNYFSFIGQDLADAIDIPHKFKPDQNAIF